MYSKDRKDALDATLSCLQDMPLYDKCQKTLIVDGRIEGLCIPDWSVVQVPRIGDKFCWGRMWDAGVGTARYPNILYLDSDRLLPNCFLEKTMDAIADDVFVFTSHHYMVLENRPLEKYKELLRRIGSDDSVLLEAEFFANLKFDIRRTCPHHGPGKNVMSGSTAFTRKTYVRLGGVDHWYCGHGAFADTDFHMRAFMGGCKFFNLELPELHYPHAKRHADSPITDQDIKLLGLNNFIHYCRKWDLTLSLAENLAVNLCVPNPPKYIKERMEIDQ